VLSRGIRPVGGDQRWVSVAQVAEKVRVSRQTLHARLARDEASPGGTCSPDRTGSRQPVNARLTL
jgi:hypothetical protein